MKWPSSIVVVVAQDVESNCNKLAFGAGQKLAAKKLKQQQQNYSSQIKMRINLIP